jgi:hypothetical protein
MSEKKQKYFIFFPIPHLRGYAAEMFQQSQASGQPVCQYRLLIWNSTLACISTPSTASDPKEGMVG